MGCLADIKFNIQSFVIVNIILRIFSITKPHNSELAQVCLSAYLIRLASKANRKLYIFQGSSAGAGSGEYHIYRNLRKREYARQDYLKKLEKFVSLHVSLLFMCQAFGLSTFYCSKLTYIVNLNFSKVNFHRLGDNHS